MGKSGNRQVQFKQFTVRDERCAMKVGTDALILGAWCEVEEASSVLDIGSGSAIVALMLAQRAKDAQVVAVELEQSAFGQGCENVEQSPFFGRIQCVHQEIQEFSHDPHWQDSFDVVVSNPPFFHGKPKSPDPSRNMARHDDTLPLYGAVRFRNAMHASFGEIHAGLASRKEGGVVCCCGESED